MRNPKASWAKQRVLKDKRNIPNPNRIREIITNIPHKETQTLVSLLYLLGCRITEIVGEQKRTIWEKEWETVTNKRGEQVKRRTGKYTKTGYIEPGLRKITINDFETIYRAENKFIIVTIHNRKHKTKKEKAIPVNLSDEIDSYLWSIIEKYIDYRRKEGKEDLFDFGKTRAYVLISQHTGFNPHWWRHIRLTHLITKYDLNERLLIKYAGWTDGRPAEGYMELFPSDLMDAFIK